MCLFRFLLVLLSGDELEDPADAESEAAANVGGPGVAVLQAHARMNDVIKMDTFYWSDKERRNGGFSKCTQVVC